MPERIALRSKPTSSQLSGSTHCRRAKAHHERPEHIDFQKVKHGRSAINRHLRKAVGTRKRWPEIEINM
jgi:hypothetical protein